MARKLEDEYSKNWLEIYLKIQKEISDLELDNGIGINVTYYFKYLGFTITNSTRTEGEINTRLA